MKDHRLDGNGLMDDIAEVLITAEELQARVAELGAQISTDYDGKNPLLVGVLRGVFVFMADLVRTITIPISVDFIGITRYGPPRRREAWCALPKTWRPASRDSTCSLSRT